MRLIVQPGDSVRPLIEAIDAAQERLQIAVFRFDRTEVEAALMRAAERGVFVHALIAYTNRGGEKNLRQLEMRLLAKGVTVARTANDLLRYHAKYLIVDQKQLLVLAFNFTSLDVEQSRSFGLVTEDEELVREAVRLFEADSKRQPYEPGSKRFVVSPMNARKELSGFITAAEKELVIYDLKVSDPGMIRLLRDRMKAGVAVRIIGKVSRKVGLDSRELRPLRLHTRSMVRDGEWVFLGSQSLRTSELETRREVGLIFEDREIAGRIRETFEADWKTSGEALAAAVEEEAQPEQRAARKLAKAISKRLPDVAPVIALVNEEMGKDAPLEIDPVELENTLKRAVKEAVLQVIERDTP